MKTVNIQVRWAASHLCGDTLKALAYSDWFNVDTSKTLHWVRKDVDFCSCELNSCVSFNRVVSLDMRCRQINRCNSSHFSSVSDQLLSHLKQLSQRFRGLIPPYVLYQDELQLGNINCPYCCVHIKVFLSLGLRPCLCLTIEKTFYCSLDFGDCEAKFIFPLISEFLEATSLLVLLEFSRKFKCSWSSSVATSVLILTNRTPSLCHL